MHTVVTLLMFFIVVLVILNLFQFSFHWLNFDRFSFPSDFKQITPFLVKSRTDSLSIISLQDQHIPVSIFLSTSLLKSLPPPNFCYFCQHFYFIPVDTSLCMVAILKSLSFVCRLTLKHKNSSQLRVFGILLFSGFQNQWRIFLVYISGGHYILTLVSSHCTNPQSDYLH